MTAKGYEEELILEHKDEKVNEIVLPRLKKKYCYEWENIDDDYKSNSFIWLDKGLDLEKEKIYSLWKNDFDLKKNLHFTDYKHIHYNEKGTCIPFLLEIEFICGIIDRGENEDRKHYFKTSSFLQTGYIWEIFAEIESKMVGNLNIEYNTIIDSGKFEIDFSTKKLPVNQVIYLKNVIVVFEKVESVTVRRREKNKIVARIIAGEVLLNKNA